MVSGVPVGWGIRATNRQCTVPDDPDQVTGPGKVGNLVDGQAGNRQLAIAQCPHRDLPGPAFDRPGAIRGLNRLVGEVDLW